MNSRDSKSNKSSTPKTKTRSSIHRDPASAEATQNKTKKSVSTAGRRVTTPRKTTKSPERNSSGSRKKGSRSAKFMLLTMALLIVTLSAVILILDQRAMKQGHVGLWESATGIRPAVSADQVFDGCVAVLNEFGVTRQQMVREGYTTSKSRDNERLRHFVYNVNNAEIFKNLTARFEDAARKKGVKVHNRHVMKQPREWILSYYTGTHGQRTHKFDLHYFLEGTPTPAPLPEHLLDKIFTPKQTQAQDGVSAEKVKTPQIALIFDDFGKNSDIAQRFLTELDVPVTLAVLPYQSHSNDIIGMAGKSGQTAFLHMPMEPLDAEAMGDLVDHYLLLSMDDDTMRNATRQMLADHKNVAGVNNHTGSRLTANRHAMDVVLAEIKRHNLIFVDSRTTADTVAEAAARSLEIPTGSRSIFIDQGYNGGDVKANMLKLAETARKEGYAIGIGHAIDTTLEEVISILPEITKSGISIVPIEELVH